MSEELVAAIASDLEAGLWLRDTCEAHGIGETTYRRWLEVPDFRALIKKAEAALQRTCLGTIGAGAEGWQGSAWIMERRFPKRWAMRVKSAIMDREDELYRRLREGLSADAYLEVMRVLAGQDEEGATPSGAPGSAGDDTATAA